MAEEYVKPEISCCPGTPGKLAWLAEILVRTVLLIIFGLSATIIHPFLRHVEPHNWPDHNYPHSDPETIHPATVFVVIVVVPLFLNIFVIIYGRVKMWPKTYKHQVNKRMLSEFTVFLLTASMGYLLNGVFTDVMKNLYGRPRPDFLSRCFTPDQFKSPGDSNHWLTLPSRINVGSITPEQQEALDLTRNDSIPFPYIEDVKPLIDTKDCINQDEKLLRSGGRRSFPSGHTSFSFAGATLCALYSIYWLRKIKSAVHMKKHLPIPGASLGLVMFFIWYVPAIYVAISRTQDYRHFPTDVMAGAIIGTFTVYVSFITYYDFSLFHYQLYQKVDKYEPEPTTQESNI